jgi:putative peptidoglycan lipid II flippase
VLAPGFTVDPAKFALTVRLMRIMLLSPVIFSISGLFMGMLNTHQRFLLPALAPALYNVGIILGAVVLTPLLGSDGLAWGVVLGALLHLLIQVPGLVGLKARLRPSFTVRDAGVQEVGRLMGPRVLGLAIVQINFWVNTNLASSMEEGSVAALQRAFYLMLLPQGIIAQSVANAVFPTFSIHVARGEMEALQATLGRVLRTVLFLAVPAMVGLVILRLPVVKLIYQYGEFTQLDAQATAWALLFYGLGLVSHSVVEIITRAFYALHDTRTPVLIGGGAMILNVILSLLLIRVIGEPGNLAMGPFAGLALANTLATTLEGGLLLTLIRPRVGGLEARRTLTGLSKTAAASAAMGLVIWFLLPVAAQLGQVLGPLVSIAAGGAIFVVCAVLLRTEETRLFADLLLRRLRPSA